jgi:RNA recognition motif-containing protein
MAFLGGLKPDTTEEKVKSALEKYGKIVSCTINPSKKAGVINAVATFSDE